MIEPTALLARLGGLLQTPRAGAPVVPAAVEPATLRDQERGATHTADAVTAAGRPAPLDRADISPEARAAAEAHGAVAAPEDELSTEEQRELTELRQRDQEVRAHEQAHQTTGGQYAGAASYTYTTGPDGQRYASGGSVPIDASPVSGDPNATIRKMRQVRAAALAPSDPSPADRQVASGAARELTNAQAELASEKETTGAGPSSTEEPTSAAALVEHTDVPTPSRPRLDVRA